MNHSAFRPTWGIAIFTGLAASLAAAAGWFAFKRNDKRNAALQTRTPTAASESQQQSTANRTRSLPDYPARLAERNSAALAARTTTSNQRRPGVAARWKSQDRLASTI